MIKPEHKFRLEIRFGHWWALIDTDEKGVRTWAPVGAVATSGDMKSVMGGARLARWYWIAGILHTLTGPICRENDAGPVEVIRGTAKFTEGPPGIPVREGQ